ncbi:MAG: hypothetical protein KF791_07555 [Verrucomicrobiae bacterium]|nr:hypothetical protein [Verrucomicrobiae bacterium]
MKISQAIGFAVIAAIAAAGILTLRNRGGPGPVDAWATGIAAADSTPQDEFQDPEASDAPPPVRDWRLREGDAPADPFAGDPVDTASPGRSEASEPLRLAAVWCQPGQTFAVINGTVVAEGGHVAGYRIDRLAPGLAQLSGPEGVVRLVVARTAWVLSPPVATATEQSSSRSGPQILRSTTRILR